ncbi:hypothetical protein Pla175_22790 [Pirellulimonas nuda]|uniref:PEP-CTERM protein-sorting domain-containing protein n=1 Tax=Pirellulimonas nuda TaxID=2528009 RepID=A0A518DBN0_9BACT|nr:hypothetical protein [Pirellulimonas nuda]QDU88895.1 hypothetical protein Pla175_22790 [Pirellulimonas nuda]
MTCCSRFLSGLTAALLVAGAARADWNLLEDFDDLTPGAIGGQGDWLTNLQAGATSNAAYDVAADPANAANQTMLVTGFNGNGYLPLGTASIAEGATSTVFLRMRATNDSDLVFGASDIADPAGAFESYEGQVVMGNLKNATAQPGGDPLDNQWKVRNVGAFDNLGTFNPNEWYNVWLVLNNATDTTGFYVSLGTGDAALLGTGGFRNGTVDPLVSLLVKTGARHNNFASMGYIDDIYIDSSGENLVIPEGVGTGGPSGDFNGDGSVNAADYTTWRDGLGTTFTQADYDVWKSNFGAGPATGAVAASTVPEPATAVLATLGSVGALMAGRRSAFSRFFS